MEIRKELQDFLNDNNILALIADQAWAELFSEAEINVPYDISALHKILVKSGIASTDQILLSLDYVPDWFFYEFDNLTSIKLPYSITSIGQSAFYNCNNLASITIPDSVRSIGAYAFSDCSNFTSITIPNSVTRIGSGTFQNCSNLTSLTIPDGVASIGDWAFYNCTKLKTIYFKGTEDQWNQVEKAKNWKSGTRAVKIIFK